MNTVNQNIQKRYSLIKPLLHSKFLKVTSVQHEGKKPREGLSLKGEGRYSEDIHCVLRGSVCKRAVSLHR